MAKLRAVPVELREANEFVANFHRHNKPVTGHRFSVGVSDGEALWGVCIVGRVYCGASGISDYPG